MTTKAKVEKYLGSVGATLTLTRDPVWKTWGGYVDPPEYHVWSHNHCHTSAVPDCETKADAYRHVWLDICNTKEEPAPCEDPDCDICSILREEDEAELSE